MKPWVDEFSFLYDDKNEDFSEIQKSFISAIDALSDEVCVYKKDYIESKEWHLVRSVGLDILQMSELPSNLPNKVIDFNEYLEIVIDPNYGLVCINC